MPRAKYAKRTGRPPTIEQRSDFRFRPDQSRKLTELLPSKLASLGVPPEYAANVPKKVKTLADLVIHATEEEVSFHRMISVLSDNPINAANVRVTVRQMREAQKPFVLGWVDDETAEIISADLDARLAAREVLAVVGNHKSAPVKNRNGADARTAKPATLPEQGGSRQNADNHAPPPPKPPAGTQPLH